MPLIYMIPEIAKIWYKVLIGGLIVGFITYILASNRLSFFEIGVIVVTSMIVIYLSIDDPDRHETSMTLLKRNPRFFTIGQCQKVMFFLAKKYNLYKFCQNRVNQASKLKKSRKHVSFNHRVEILKPTGSISTESLNDLFS